MADPPSYPGTNSTTDDGSARYQEDTAPRRPRWKIALVWAIIAALLLLMIILHLTGAVGPGTNP
jgi:hypothetical protein